MTDDFRKLVATIRDLHTHLQAGATAAVNQALTIRNFLTGYYIIEFEQGGENRAEYGKKLLQNLADDLSIKGLTEPELSRCRQFYTIYPHILGTLSQTFGESLPKQILGALSQESDLKIISEKAISPSSETSDLSLPAEKIITSLSFSHIVELIKIDDAFKRTFYEIECIKGVWSVRELKRQIASQYYERSGLSNKPEKLAKLVRQGTHPQQAKDIIKNSYAFEFLDLPTQDIVEESDLETALLNHLQQFIIELGNGFCFEARQKRILIGENYYFIDLVFYHRILKCHVLLELKIGAFNHGDAGQLNTYLNYYKKNICAPEDNPPVGILLVAEKDKALVEYATAGMDQQMFVQEYMLKLPSVDELKDHIEQELKELR